MIREPYNINPYNSTIDTSKVNNFGFTFSGDELGSWKVEIAKNNTSPDIVYTSKEFVPSDVGYEHIYDSDRVEGMTLPSTFATNTEDDGLLRSGGATSYILTVSDRSKSWSNSLKVQINNNTFSITTIGSAVDGYRQLTITANPLPRLPVGTIVQYIVYNPSEEGASDYFDTIGEDLIWRLKLYEPQKAIQNFLRQGRFLQDASQRVMINDTNTVNTYEGEVSLSVLENSGTATTSETHPVQIGDDLFVESINDSTAVVSIAPSLNYTSLEDDLQTFVEWLNTYNVYLEIDNQIFTISSNGAAISSDGSYIILNIESEENITSLSARSFYNYTIEFYDETPQDTSLINNIVTIYEYTVPEDSFGVIIGSNSLNEIGTLWYYSYSNGDVRAFYTFENSISNFVRGLSYRLYSCFLYSNWYFFQSRETPELTLSTKTQDFPIGDYNNRKLELVGTYFQSSGIGVRYHTWSIDKITENGTTEIFKSKEIYNSNFNYIYEPLEDQTTYMVTFTVVNQAGVETSITGDLITNLNVQDIDAACIATVDEDNHTVEVTWLNGLGAEPDEENNDFGNRIGVGESEQDVHITEQLTYSTISGGNIEISKAETLVQTGLIINDDAKANGNNKEFYNSDILTLGSQSGSVHFRKEELDVKIENGGTWFKLLTDTNGQVDSTTRGKTNYFIGKNYVWQDSVNWTDTYYWTETQSDTNCYYYQFVIGNGKAKGKKAAYWNTTPVSVSGSTITIPYNPLIDATTVGNLRVRIDNGVEGSEDTVYTVTNKTSTTTATMTLTLGSTPTGTPVQVVVYDNVGTALPDNTFTVDTSAPYNRFILGHDTNYFYFTVSNNATNTIYNNTAPLDFGEKPSWNDNASMVINARFNGTLLSSRQEDIGSSISGYQVYRRKFRVIGSNGMEPIYDEDNPIYTRLVGTFDLSDEDLTTAAKFKFIDWSIENRGTFDYIIYPISENSSALAEIKTREKITTDWYGWSFTSFDKFPTGHYEPFERWLFKLNVETSGYSHQTNKVFNQGFNRYPKVSIGTINYITTNLTCLIGNIDKELRRSVLYRTLQGYTNDSINRIEDWENFSNSSNLVLVKDYKGRSFIGVIDGNAMSFQDIVIEILTKLSFNVTQIDDAANYQIFSIEEG